MFASGRPPADFLGPLYGITTIGRKLLVDEAKLPKTPVPPHELPQALRPVTDLFITKAKSTISANVEIPKTDISYLMLKTIFKEVHRPKIPICFDKGIEKLGIDITLERALFHWLPQA